MDKFLSNSRFIMNTGVWISVIGIALSPKMGFFETGPLLVVLSIFCLTSGLFISTFANILRLKERRALTPVIIISQCVTTGFAAAFIIAFFIYDVLNLWLVAGILGGLGVLLFGRTVQEKE
ncbi:hypothetical protein [Bacillus horti]|uniref:EamA domain-containing protein n=1 Tax=Caldalkalibacillus horti TaxID=77523 RepID=A0ABT9W5P9_9BACI|nr:hypothetical protein [Bacillus horti]MDQ0168165.1 hypothetical protein [Bacillus horti]